MAEALHPKRKRVEETEDVKREQSEPFTRSQFWFEDGNIVLQVGKTQFRVHTFMLARHSSVFRDMFKISQPIQPEEPLVDGCPVVTLTDALEDVKVILSIFYDNIK